MAPNDPYVVEPGMREDANRVKLRLRAVGVDLDLYKWKLISVFYDPVGFEFQCTDYRRLIHDAENSPRLGLHFADLPGSDLWKKADVKSVGYTEIGAAGPVHLDVAVDQPERCRAYLMPANVKVKADAMRRAQITDARSKPVYAEIARRLANFNPPVILDDHIAKLIRINDTALDGVNFVARDAAKLKKALMDARDGSGQPAFAHTKGEHREHWALKASFAATDGTGFREIFRVKLADRPLLDSGPLDGYARRSMRRFAGTFAENTAVPDVSSLHCAVSVGGCNIHIDEMGFVLTDETGMPVLDADFLQHLVNELLFKTYAKKILPDAVVDHVNLILPNSFVEFNRIGVGVDLYKTKKYRVAINATCSVFGERDCSGTVTVGGRF